MHLSGYDDDYAWQLYFSTRERLEHRDDDDDCDCLADWSRSLSQGCFSASTSLFCGISCTSEAGERSHLFPSRIAEE